MSTQDHEGLSVAGSEGEGEGRSEGRTLEGQCQSDRGLEMASLVKERTATILHSERLTILSQMLARSRKSVVVRKFSCTVELSWRSEGVVGRRPPELQPKRTAKPSFHLLIYAGPLILPQAT